MNSILKLTLMLVFAETVLCQTSSRLEPIWKECQKEVGVTDEELKAYETKAANNNPSEKLKCHVKCVMEKFTFFKNDAFDGEIALRVLSKVPQYKGKEAELSQTIKDCKDIKGSNTCDTAFKATQCFKEHPSMELFKKM